MTQSGTGTGTGTGTKALANKYLSAQVWALILRAPLTHAVARPHPTQ